MGTNGNGAERGQGGGCLSQNQKQRHGPGPGCARNGWERASGVCKHRWRHQAGGDFAPGRETAYRSAEEVRPEGGGMIAPASLSRPWWRRARVLVPLTIFLLLLVAVRGVAGYF